MNTKKQNMKSKIDNLWNSFCKREMSLDQLIEEINKLENNNLI